MPLSYTTFPAIQFKLSGHRIYTFILHLHVKPNKTASFHSARQLSTFIANWPNTTEHHSQIAKVMSFLKKAHIDKYKSHSNKKVVYRSAHAIQYFYRQPQENSLLSNVQSIQHWIKALFLEQTSRGLMDPRLWKLLHMRHTSNQLWC